MRLLIAPNGREDSALDDKADVIQADPSVVIMAREPEEKRVLLRAVFQELKREDTVFS